MHAIVHVAEAKTLPEPKKEETASRLKRSAECF